MAVSGATIAGSDFGSPVWAGSERPLKDTGLPLREMLHRPVMYVTGKLQRQPNTPAAIT